MKTKASPKKSPAKKKDPIDDLEDSLGADLGQSEENDLRAKIDAEVGKGPQFDSAEDSGHEPEDRAEAAGPHVGKRVRFKDGDGKVVEGVVLSQVGDELVVEDLEKGEWDAEAKNVEFIAEESPAESVEPEEVASGEAAPEEAPAAPAKGKKGKTTETARAAEAADYEVFAIEISKIKIPKVKPREPIAKDSDEYRALYADIRDNPQEYPVILTSREKPVLLDGLQRIEINKALGRTTILARVKAVASDLERLWHGLRLNKRRVDMTWLELGRAFAELTKDGQYKQAQIAREFGISPSEVSRLIVAAGFPAPVLKIAETQRYPQAVFTEMAAAPEKARARVVEFMEAGSDLTAAAVRAIAQEERKKEDEAVTAETGAPVVRAHGGARNTTGGARAGGAVYRDLTNKELAAGIHARVFADRVEMRFTIPWKNKTFRGFDLRKALKDAIDEAYGAGEVSIKSDDDLGKAMGALRAELA